MGTVAFGRCSLIFMSWRLDMQILHQPSSGSFASLISEAREIFDSRGNPTVEARDEGDEMYSTWMHVLVAVKTSRTKKVLYIFQVIAPLQLAMASMTSMTWLEWYICLTRLFPIGGPCHQCLVPRIGLTGPHGAMELHSANGRHFISLFITDICM